MADDVSPELIDADEVEMKFVSDGTMAGSQIFVGGKPLANPVTALEFKWDVSTGIISAILEIEMVDLDIGLVLTRRDSYICGLGREGKGKSAVPSAKTWEAIRALEAEA